MITVVGTLKGGSGKSTLAFNLGIWLATKNQNVTLVDLDPQCTLSDALEVREEDGYLPAVRRHTKLSKEWVNAAEEHILIDVGTANMTGLKKAISLADRVIMPVAPSQADIWSTQRFLLLVASTIQEKPPQMLAFLNRADTNAAVRETAQALEALRLLPGIFVLDATLGQRTAFRRSFSEGRAVFELEPKGKAANELHKLAKLIYPDLK